MYFSRSYLIVMSLVFMAAGSLEWMTPLGVDSVVPRIGMIITLFAVAGVLLLGVVFSAINRNSSLAKFFSGDTAKVPKWSPRSFYLLAALLGVVVIYYLLSTVWQMWYFGLRWPGMNLLEALLFSLMLGGYILAARRAGRQIQPVRPWGVLDGVLIGVIVVAAIATLGIHGYLFWSKPIADYGPDPKIIPVGLAFTPDNKTLIAGGFGMIRQWDIASGQPIGQPLIGTGAETEGMALMPDGKTVVSAEGEDYIRLWDLASGQSISLFQSPTYGLTSMALSADGKIIASATRTGAEQGRITLWDAARGWPMGQPIIADTLGVPALAFSPDGKILVSGARAGFRFDVATGQPISPPLLAPGSMSNLVFSPDGKVLVGAGGMGISLWDGVSGEPLANQPLTAASSQVSSGVSSLAFSPDGTILAWGSGDGSVRLWNMTAGQVIGQ